MSDPATHCPVVPDDLFALRWLQSAAISPDGTAVACAVSAYVEADDEDYAHLWLVDVPSGAARQLTHGPGDNRGARFSPDGHLLAFISKRSGKAQVYLMPVDGGEAWPLTSLPQGVGGDLAWSPDGSQIAFTAGPASEGNDARDKPQPYRVDRYVYRFDGLGYLDQAVQDIYVIPAAGGEPRRLTADRASHGDPQWSPDGREILYTATMLPDTPRCFHPRLRIVNLDGRTREVVGDGMDVTCSAWLPGGQAIIFVAAPADRPIGSKSDLWIVDASGHGQPENRSATLAVGVGNRLTSDMPSQLTRTPPRLLVTPDGVAAIVQVQEGGHVSLYRIALAGPEHCQPIVTGERACLPLMLDRQGNLLFAAATWHEPLDLYLAGPTGQDERRLTAWNAELLSGLAMPVVEPLAFAGPDGTAVEGWMIMPPTATPPFPTVLVIHGGPHGAFGATYHFDTQMLVGAGFAVVMVNHRASTGYGDPFATAIKGDWGNLDAGDLLAGVDEAIARGLADPHRLGVCGLSGGGNLTCWLVGHTDRFRAAVPENPLTNWLSFYGVSDIGVWFAVEELGGHPHEIPEIYARCSPITYAHRCRTPTLLIQGEADWRCPAEQSEQFYTVLKANGCTAEMLRLPNSAHGGAITGSPASRRAQNQALLDWMQRFV